MKYGYTKKINMSFEEALDEVRICLAEQWFGVMTQIDVQDSMKQKLWKDIEQYMIFGTCNPQLAYESLQEDYEIALVMPCNVIVYEQWGSVFTSALLPTIGTSFVENRSITEVAEKAEKLLIQAIDNI